jgi:hypothetical protein
LGFVCVVHDVQLDAVLGSAKPGHVLPASLSEGGFGPHCVLFGSTHTLA